MPVTQDNARQPSMDVTTSNSFVDPVARAAAPLGAAQARPDYAARTARFDELAGAVLDTSGRFTETQRVEAYQTLQTLSATGQLIGVEDDRRKVLDQVTFESDISRRAERLSASFIQSVNVAAQSGGAGGALEAAAAAFGALSPSDQTILFATTLNAADRTGARPFADIQAWRDNTSAQLKMVDYLKTAGVVGVDGRLDHRAAAARSDDVKLAAALKLSLRRDNNSADWTQSVLRLFGGERRPDRIDLSPAAQKALDAAPGLRSRPEPAPYRAGELVSRRA
jgi:hypothetical protein